MKSGDQVWVYWLNGWSSATLVEHYGQLNRWRVRWADTGSLSSVAFHVDDIRTAEEHIRILLVQ